MDKLSELRFKIDQINSQILNLIIKRNQIARKIGEYKKEKNLPVNNFEREKEIYENIMASARRKGLNRNFVRRLFDLIFKQSKREQEYD